MISITLELRMFKTSHKYDVREADCQISAATKPYFFHHFKKIQANLTSKVVNHLLVVRVSIAAQVQNEWKNRK